MELDGARAQIFRDVPALDGRRTAAIGRLRCETAGAGTELIERVCRELAAEGIRAVLGPMDGDTWNSYRVVVESDGSPPFLMEPISGPCDLAAFTGAGFGPIAHYISARQDLRQAAAAAPGPPDLQITPWEGQDPEALFAEVHAISVDAFAGNPFFRPLPLDTFLSIYMPMVPLLRPDLLLFARSPDGALQGYFFAVPDYAQGPQPRDVIFKTYASRVPGAGRAMVARAVQTSARLGYRTAIHALMYVDNRSTDRSGRLGARIFRRYALMGRHL